MSLEVRVSSQATFTTIALADPALAALQHELLVSHEEPWIAFCSLLDGQRHDDGDQPAVRVYDYRRGALVDEIHYWHGKMCAGPQGRAFRLRVGSRR